MAIKQTSTYKPNGTAIPTQLQRYSKLYNVFKFEARYRTQPGIQNKWYPLQRTLNNFLPLNEHLQKIIFNFNLPFLSVTENLHFAVAVHTSSVGPFFILVQNESKYCNK
jgi:hypothetical protein